MWSSCDTGVFPRSFIEFSEFRDKSICHYITEKTLEPAISCVRDQDATHVKDGNFKMNPIHVSVIYQFP